MTVAPAVCLRAGHDYSYFSFNLNFEVSISEKVECGITLTNEPMLSLRPCRWTNWYIDMCGLFKSIGSFVEVLDF